MNKDHYRKNFIANRFLLPQRKHCVFLVCSAAVNEIIKFAETYNTAMIVVTKSLVQDIDFLFHGAAETVVQLLASGVRG